MQVYSQCVYIATRLCNKIYLIVGFACDVDNRECFVYALFLECPTHHNLELSELLLFVNSTELCFELQSTNDGGMDATKQFDAFFSCDNHNGTIASGKVTSLLFQILLYTC